MGQCCYCCLSEDDKIDRLFEKIENCTEISKLEPGSRRPTLIAGTVTQLSNHMIAPVTQKQCVYYEVRAEEEWKRYREHEDENGRTTWEEYHTWEHLYTDEQKVDFMFVDPKSPTLRVVVPIGTEPIKVHSEQDGYSQSYDQRNTTTTFPIMAGFSIDFDPSMIFDTHQDHRTGMLRFFESSFHLGEKLAVIGAIEEYQFQQPDETIEIGKKIVAMNKDLVTDEYAEKNEWSDWDKRAWEDLLKTPAIILTDVQKHTADL